MRSALVDFVEQHKALENLLDADFADLSSLHPDDGFPKRMFRFRREAEERLAALKDTLQLADGTYQRALTLYGEDTKNITSTEEFFSVFKTFVTSYKVRSLFVLSPCCLARRRLTSSRTAVQQAREDNRRLDERAPKPSKPPCVPTRCPTLPIPTTRD